jgi:hypothetical protein
VDRLTGDTGAEDSHLAQSMGQLSLVGGECLDASSYSVNNLSRAAHLPNVSPLLQLCDCYGFSIFFSFSLLT